MSNITDKIKQAVYESTQQLIKPVYEKIKETFSTKKELEEVDNIVGKLELRTHIGEELDYGEFKPLVKSYVADNPIQFKKTSGNIELDDANEFFILKPYRKYKINGQFNTSVNSIYKLCNVNDDILASSFNYVSGSQVGCTMSKIIETKNKEVKICIKTNLDCNVTDAHIRYNYLIIEEINREVMLDPAEEAKNLEFDYGYYTMSKNVSTQLAKDVIIFDTKEGGNLDITSGIVTLKANKKYKLKASCGTTVDDIGYRFYNITDDEFMSNNLAWSLQQPIGNKITCAYIETVKETKVALVSNNTKTMSYNYSTCFIEIEEITHPYYFNYYKDSISSTMLFEGKANSLGTYQLNDDINNYEWIKITVAHDNPSVPVTNVCKCSEIFNIKEIKIGQKNDITSMFLTYRNDLHFDSTKTFTIDVIDKTYDIYISKIEGIGFNYDNPYKDLVNGFDINSLTTEQLTILKAKLSELP